MNFEKLQQCLDELVTQYGTPGVDCVVYQNHKKLFRYFAGMKDLEKKIPLAGDELYYIFSMTKMLTCVSALQLLEQGKYQLSDHLSKYMPEFSKMRVSAEDFDVKAAAKIASGSTIGETGVARESGYAQNPITILHLFTMMAGFDYNLSAPGIRDALGEGKTSTRDLVGALSKTVLGFEPGTRFRYSLCHDILGALVEIWSGEKLGDYMQKHIFEPLGMKNTFFGAPRTADELQRMASLYKFYPEYRTNPDYCFQSENDPQLQELTCAYNLSPEYQSGGAGLVSCPEDYALFLDAMACGGIGKSGKKILSPETIRDMRTNRLFGKPLTDFTANQDHRPGYGYGLGVRTHICKAESGALSPEGEFGWDGAAGGYSMVDTENKLSLTYFQHALGWRTDIQGKLRDALYAAMND